MAHIPPNFCDQCSAPLPVGAKFCGRCGAEAIEPAATTDATPAPLANWQMNVPLINNRFIMADVCKACLLTALLFCLIIGAIFGATGGMEGVKQAVIASGIALLALLVLSILVMVIFLGNAYPMEFILTQNDVVMISRSDRAHAANRLALILGLLGGKPGAAAAGLSAMSRETIALHWENVHSVRRHPEQSVIVLKGGMLETIYLYCTPQNYNTISALVENHAGKRAIPGSVDV